MNEGVYWLVFYNPKPRQIRIGALGNIDFKEGFYVYIGSAMAPKNTSSNALLNRVIRHCRPESLKKLHWHIDYFITTPLVELLRIYLIPSHTREECLWANYVATLADEQIIRFGCSDCECASHFFYFKNEPFQQSPTNSLYGKEQ